METEGTGGLLGEMGLTPNYRQLALAIQALVNLLHTLNST